MLKLIIIIAAIGTIIIESESKYCNGPHEYFEECVRTCDPQTCESIGKTYHCPFKRTKCEAECRCELGYYRNKSGECIPKDQCDNEKNYVIFSTSNSNTESKKSYKSRIRQSKDSSTNEDSSSSISESSESSLKSMSTSDEDTIVVIDYSGSICGLNEIWTNCLNGGCGRQNCSQLGSPDICINIRADYCIPGCRCETNYLRNEHGICVPVTQCPKPVCGYHEIFDLCPASCPPRRCDVDERLIKCKKPPQLGDKECSPSCRCADDFYRTNEGTCVRKDQCPKCHGKDEVYEECPSTCPPQTCHSIWAKYKCPIQPAVCKPSCRCKPHMYRNQIGECISRDECLKCPGSHEYYSCGGACDNECDKLSEQNQTSCPIVNITCNKKCYCEAGYARNHNNECVPSAECPPKCSKNEVYVKDLNGKQRPQFCWQYLLGFDEKETNTPIVPGCICIKGYARHNKGTCIPIADCFENTIRNKRAADECNENEEYVTNVNLIDRPQNCYQYLLFSQQNKSSQTGKPGCICAEYYVKDNAGKCIPSKDCTNIILRG